MKGLSLSLVALMAAASLLASHARAQNKETSVPYLRAAISSLSVNDRVTFTAIYDAQAGLQVATGRYLRGKGYSRFVVIDPKSGVFFDSAYCLQESKVFSDLLEVKGRQTFVFYGYKDRGESKEDAVIVTQAERVGPETAPGAKATAELPKRTFRVTLTDLSTSNQTVIVNVEPGKPCRLLNSLILVEEESAPTGVQSIGGQP
jgi:hypothetical protein